MFKILQKTFATGIVTKAYPAELAHVSEHFRGRPHFDFEKWTDARPAAEVCPTGAISLRDSQDSREVTVDYGLCVFCGLCAEVSSDKAVRITQESLANACRHSGSRRLSVELPLDGDVLRVRVRAWGVGFDPKSPAPGHFGVSGIRRRVELLHGTAAIHSEPGKGTRSRRVRTEMAAMQ